MTVKFSEQAKITKRKVDATKPQARDTWRQKALALKSPRRGARSTCFSTGYPNTRTQSGILSASTVTLGPPIAPEGKRRNFAGT